MKMNSRENNKGDFHIGCIFWHWQQYCNIYDISIMTETCVLQAVCDIGHYPYTADKYKFICASENPCTFQCLLAQIFSKMSIWAGSRLGQYHRLYRCSTHVCITDIWITCLIQQKHHGRYFCIAHVIHMWHIL